jgi:hypothetical protein
MNRGIYYGAGHKFFSCANHKSNVHLRIALWEQKKLHANSELIPFRFVEQHFLDIIQNSAVLTILFARHVQSCAIDSSI